jgi:hypothetical protein
VNAYQMTPADKRHAVILALKTWGNAKSDSLIAGQVGCSDSTVFRMRQVLHLKNPGDRVTGKDGKSYPATRARKPWCFERSTCLDLRAD